MSKIDKEQIAVMHRANPEECAKIDELREKIDDLLANSDAKGLLCLNALIMSVAWGLFQAAGRNHAVAVETLGPMNDMIKWHIYNFREIPSTHHH